MPFALENNSMEMKLEPTQPGGPLSTKKAEPELWLQKILVPVEFTASSTVALRYAAALARECHAKVMLLYVQQLNIADETWGVPRARFLAEMREESDKRLHALGAEYLGPEIVCERITRVGRPCDAIVGVAREKAVDLIVLPANEHVGLLRWLRPHTVDRVVKNAPCPVLVMRATHQPFVWRLRSAQRGGGFIGDSHGR